MSVRFCVRPKKPTDFSLLDEFCMSVFSLVYRKLICMRVKEVSIFMIAIPQQRMRNEQKKKCRPHFSNQTSLFVQFAIFVASKNRFFFISTHNARLCLSHNLAINANDACAKFTYFSKYFTISTRQRQSGRTQLRFQRQKFMVDAL